MLSTLVLAGHPAHWAGPLAGGFGFLFLLVPLFWIGVFALIFTIARRRRHAWAAAGGYGPEFGHPGFGSWGAQSRSAEATLGERFAQGDIDEKEYRARLEVLRANAYPQPPVK